MSSSQSCATPPPPDRSPSDAPNSPMSYQDEMGTYATASGGMTPAGPDSGTQHSEEPHVNVEDEDEDELNLFQYREQEPLLPHSTAPDYESEAVPRGKKRGKSSSGPSSSKRTRRQVLSDNEDEIAPTKKQRKQARKTGSPAPDDDDSGDWQKEERDSDPPFDGSDVDIGSDENDSWGRKPTKKSKGADTKKGSTKRGKAAGSSAKKGRKSLTAKASLATIDQTDDLPPAMDDSSYSGTRPTSATASRASSPAPPTNVPSKDKPAEPARTKRKLPTIRKNKTQSTPTTETQRPAAPAASEPANVSPPLLMTSTGRQIIEPKPTGDIDLRNPFILQDLMHQSLPRANTGRREKDERRKELNSLREKYIKKLEKDYATTFDLQAQRDKIEKFEAQLRRGDSAIKYPNILGARMREDWEEKKRRNDRTLAPPDDGEPEEGELQ